jgi:DNA modification methylase
MNELGKESVDLIVTSPPYPMIEMWDEMFIAHDMSIKSALLSGKVTHAFELMHNQLDQTWNECYRVLKPGGILCINIGDATRTINKNFQLFSSHSRILHYCFNIGFQNLPNIIWRKQTNSPNKFMGSGMLPPGAYVTLEHEYILIFRKGEKRKYIQEDEKEIRRESSYFWEERNVWFSDVWWDLKGIGQALNQSDLRERSAAYPFELVYRLINMYSTKGATVLDPFLGTGTTMAAAMASERNSVGYEIECDFSKMVDLWTNNIVEYANTYIAKRLLNHIKFVENNKNLKNINTHYNFPCVSKQEVNILLKYVDKVERGIAGEYVIRYVEEPEG